jgi:hypothetical protein
VAGVVVVAVPGHLGAAVREGAGVLGWPRAPRWGRLCGLLRGRPKKIVAGFGVSRSLRGMSARDLNQTSAATPQLQLVGERYVSRLELAGIMGVSLATVDRMVAEGMPSVTWGRRTRRFRASEAISWASERGRAA